MTQNLQMIKRPGAARSMLFALVRFSHVSSDFFLRLNRGFLWPKIDLIIRFWLAKVFFVSGLLKVMHWQTALDLAAYEYPVSWMTPLTAAHIGVSIELLGAALLALGFMTRYAVVPMLILTLVMQFAYLPFDNQLFWAILFGWYAVQGAGTLSVDALLRRGLTDSALPLVPRIMRASQWVRANLTPLYLSAARIWLGTGLLLVTLRSALPNDLLATITPGKLALGLPLSTTAQVPGAFALIGGSLLLLGLATRYVSLVMILVLFLGAMLDARVADPVYLLMVFAVLFTFGAGKIAVDPFVAGYFSRRLARFDDRSPNFPGLPRIVIVGAGFGGISCAVALRSLRASITLIDRTNHHLFQPLLYQVATAALSPGDIAAPVRPLFRDAFRTRVLLGTVTGVNSQQQEVLIGDKVIPYDYLVIATGATHSYFGKDQWAPFAPGLKRIEDATEIRRRILTAFERAEATDDPTERLSLLTFLIVGGGPTGVEMAGAIAELARFGMDQEFRNFDPAEARVILVQSAARLLPSFPQALATVAQRSLEKLGVQVLVGSRVEDIDANGVAVGGGRIAATTVIWAAGVMASPAANWLQVAQDAAGRVKVAVDFSVPGLTNVFVIGDTCLNQAWKGQVVPGLAPAAKQGGRYVARQIRARIEGRQAIPPFAYRHYGSLATIGRKAAVADFGFVKLSGAAAWWLWGLIHISFLVGLRNRISTILNWFWAYLTFGGGIRLITGTESSSQFVDGRRTSIEPVSVSLPIVT